MKMIILVCCLALGLSSCFFFTKVSFYSLPDGGIRPKNPNFHFAKNPFKLLDSFPIDTNSIYVSYFLNVRSGRTHFDTAYYFLRFFNDGRYFSSYIYDKFPDSLAYNNLSMGFVGYYKLVDSSITTELFVAEDADYINYYGHVSKGKVFFTQKMPRTIYSRMGLRRKLRPQKVFIKHKVKLNNFKLEW